MASRRWTTGFDALGIVGCDGMRKSALLLDEIAEGVQPSIAAEIVERLQAVRRTGGTSILIVDQELTFVAALSSRVLVMQKGRLDREVSPDGLSTEDVLGGFGFALMAAVLGRQAGMASVAHRTALMLQSAPGVIACELGSWRH